MSAVLAVGVVALGLTGRVEFAVGTWVVADAGHVDPVAAVARRIVVEEHVLKPTGPEAPVDPEVVHEVAGHVLAAPVGHEARRSELPHVGIDEIALRPALAPRLEDAAVLPPLGRLGLDAALVEDAVAVAHGHVAEIVPPNQLEDEPIGVLVLLDVLLESADLGMDLPRADAAQREPRRELGTVVGAEQAVAGLLVDAQLLGLPEIMVETVPSRLGPALERQHATGIRPPWPPRQGLPSWARHRSAAHWAPSRIPAQPKGSANLGPLLHFAAETREDIGQLLQRERQVVRVVHRQLLLESEVEHCPHLRLAVQLLAGVLGGGKYRLRPVFIGQRLQTSAGSPWRMTNAPPMSSRSAFRSANDSNRNCVRNGPGLDMAPAVFGPLMRVHDEDGNDLRGGLHGRIEGGIVGDPQVVSEPDQAAHGQRFSRLAKTASPRSSKGFALLSGHLVPGAVGHANPRVALELGPVAGVEMPVQTVERATVVARLVGRIVAAPAAVRSHLLHVVGRGGIGLGPDDAPIGELAHAARVGDLHPLDGVEIDAQVPLVHLIAGMDAQPAT